MNGEPDSPMDPNESDVALKPIYKFSKHSLKHVDSIISKADDLYIEQLHPVAHSLNELLDMIIRRKILLKKINQNDELLPEAPSGGNELVPGVPPELHDSLEDNEGDSFDYCKILYAVFIPEEEELYVGAFDTEGNVYEYEIHADYVAVAEVGNDTQSLDPGRNTKEGEIK